MEKYTSQLSKTGANNTDISNIYYNAETNLTQNGYNLNNMDFTTSDIHTVSQSYEQNRKLKEILNQKFL